MATDAQTLALNAAQGGISAALQLGLPATVLLALFQQLSIASMAKSHPGWFRTPPDTSGGATVANVVAAAVGWFAAAAVVKDAPHVYDGVPTPLRLR